MTHQYGNPPGQQPPGQLPGSGPPHGDGELKARAQQVGDQARAQAEARLDQQKQGAAERLDRLASSVRAAAGELEQQDDAQLSQYVSRFAGSLGELADSLRSKNVDELMRDLRAIARRNPGLFVAGSVAVGFGLARFARASSQHPHGQHATGWDGEADTMGAWALDGGSSGGYRGSLSSHGPDSMGSAAGARGSSYAAGSTGSHGEGSASSATGGAVRSGLSTGAPQSGAGMAGSSGPGTGRDSAGGSATPGRTPPTTRGGTQP